MQMILFHSKALQERVPSVLHDRPSRGSEIAAERPRSRHLVPDIHERAKIRDLPNARQLRIPQAGRFVLVIGLTSEVSPWNISYNLTWKINAHSFHVGRLRLSKAVGQKLTPLRRCPDHRMEIKIWNIKAKEPEKPAWSFIDLWPPPLSPALWEPCLAAHFIWSKLNCK